MQLLRTRQDSFSSIISKSYCTKLSTIFYAHFFAVHSFLCQLVLYLISGVNILVILRTYYLFCGSVRYCSVDTQMIILCLQRLSSRKMEGICIFGASYICTSFALQCKSLILMYSFGKYGIKSIESICLNKMH